MNIHVVETAIVALVRMLKGSNCLICLIIMFLFMYTV